jgi:hypothetical protein
MRSQIRFSLLGTLVAASLAISAPAAQAAFGIEKFVAVNCKAGHEACAQKTVGPFSEPNEPTKEEAEEAGYIQAGGHVPFGITDFKVNTEGELLKGEQKPVEGKAVTHIRTDVAPGLATSPPAVPECLMEDKKHEHEFGVKEAIPGTGFYTAPTCTGETVIGENKATVFVPGGVGDLPLHGSVYNLVPSQGLSSEFGVALELPKPLTEGILKKAFAEHPLELPEPEKKLTEEFLETQQYFAHTLIEGSVEWAKEEKGTNQGDYHDYFEINVSPALPLVSSRLVFKGNVEHEETGRGDFITNATNCPGNNTTRLAVTDAEGTTVTKPYTTPIGLSGCNLVRFEPTFTVTPATTERDQADGLTTEVGLTRHPKSAEIDSSQLKTAVVQLPEGMTLNESAAREITEHCTPEQIGIHTRNPVACPAGSKIGTVILNVPGLPPESLTGNLYLGGPASGPISSPPYIMYIDAESSRYGVSVRLKGEVTPNEVTGQLTTTFSENPEQPFTNAILHFNQGVFAPLANPLVCGPATTNTSLIPYTGTPAQSPFSQFVVDSNGKAAACASPLPFSLTQSTQDSSANAGGHTNATFNLVRPSGDQYLSRVRTTLPAGLAGAIPAVTLCGEPQASTGSCPSNSQIGTATVEAGAGLVPFTFKGPVYMTGPYSGAPFGLSIAVAAVAGPFNLGTVVTRAKVSVDPHTAQVIVEASLPRIVKAVGMPSSGILLRLRKISVAVNKQGFLYNPTNCSPLSTETTAYAFTAPGGGETASFNLASSFQVGNCGALSFKPAFKATSNAKTSKLNGASLETTINEPAGQANIKSVTVQLPLQLPSRLTTLQQACLAATFEADPFHCPKGSFVGGVRANTPLLPSKMTGPAILVSHANLAFPDLDLVLEGNGVRVILVGNTDIKKGITTTKFASTPDVQVSSVTVNLPVGPHSSLAAFGSLCAKPLLMPTTLVGWNGKTIKQTNKILVRGCPVKILRHRVRGNAAFVTVQTFAAGRVSGGGASLATVYRRLRGPATITLRVPLSRSGQGRGRPFSTRLRVGFVPSARREHASISFAGVRFS